LMDAGGRAYSADQLYVSGTQPEGQLSARVKSL
jgi:hypothetical protein